jgi:hypothetical protein
VPILLSQFLSPLRQDRLHTADQSLDVLVEIAPGIDLQTVPVDQFLQAIGKLLDIRHRRTFHQDWNDRHAVAESRLDLDANRICRIVDPSPPPWLRSRPTFADDDDRDIGPGKDGIDVLSEIDTQWDVIDIPEYGSGAVMSDKTIEYSPGDRGGIISPIRNCYPCHLTNPQIL